MSSSNIKKLSILLAFCFLVLILISCTSTERNNSAQTTHDSKNMPDDFDIYYSEWINVDNKNIFDTYNGYIQKDLITAGTSKVKYSATKEVLDSIYQEIIKLNVCSIDKEMTSSKLTKTNSIVGMSPCTYYEINFTIDGKKYTILGDETSDLYINENEQANSFCSFIQFMKNLIHSTEEYKSLPEAEGGYA